MRSPSSQIPESAPYLMDGTWRPNSFLSSTNYWGVDVSMNLCTETYTLYVERCVFASKDTSCYACREPIRRHEKYFRIGALFEGEWSTILRCVRCQEIHQHLRSLVDAYDQSWPDECLNCGCKYEEIHGGPPPPEIAALAFMLPGDELPIQE